MISLMANERILIVHDDPDMRAALRMSLEAAGYEVQEAISNPEGLQKVQEITPALVILDVAVETKSDLQISLALRNPAPQSPYAACRHIPILMLTAPHTTTSLRVGPDEAYLPVDDFADKPIDPDALLAQVRTLIA